MGFYGNIQNFNKISLQFDLIYPSRFQMDNSTALDGVFLGRYVAIDYGEMPITGYYNTDDKQFYTVRENQNAEVRIEAQTNKIYQDIGSGEPAFYYWDKSGQYVKIQNSSAQLNSSYVQNYHIDVNNYGAAYDGTVWQKTYDPATNKYKYVLVAELNAKTPSFHLVVDKPTNVPVTPYFDRDSTNMDYYLHMAPSYGHRIKKIPTGGQSDEKADHYEIVYTNTGTTNINWREETKEVDGDIYYNKAGFDDTKRTYSDTENTINYEYAKSGRIYGQQDAPIFVEGAPENDTYDWFFRVPALGNAVCSVWDKLYGYNKDTNDRFIELSQKQDDTESHLVTYSRDTIYGTVNELRDALGYKFIDAKSVTLPDTTEDKNEKVKVTNTYIRTGVSESIDYKLLDSIFYEDQNDGTTDYYFYRYKPIYEKVSSIQEGKTYYVKPTDDDVYVLANLENFNASDRNGKPIDPLYTTYYTRTDRWIKSRVKSDYNYNNVYGLINTLWHLIGTHAQDERSLDTVYGAINYIKDIVSNINLNLSPGKMLHVNDKGVIETTETYYPSSTIDANRVLVGNPNESESKVSWENRVRKIGVVEPDTSEIAWDIQTGTIDTNTNNNNVINFKAGNKWIGLHVDTGEQLIQVLHSKSNQDEHDFDEDVEIASALDGTSQTDNKIILPVLETDNAGHVIGYSTNTFYIPHNFKSIVVTDNHSDTDSTQTNDTLTADNIVDTWTIAPQNKWIEIAADPKNDKITIGHKYSSQSKHNFAEDVVIDDDIDGTRGKDCEFTIPLVETDNAGHVIGYTTKTIYVPYVYHDIALVEQSSAETAITTNNGEQSADATNDKFTFATGNQWIEARIDEDKITFAHALIDSEATQNWEFKSTATTGWQAASGDGNKLTIPTFEIDNAGHIVRSNSVDFYIPHNFRNITVGANGADVDATQTTGTIEADSTTDTWTIASQNKWLKVAADSVNDKITIGHSYSDLEAWQFTPSATEGMKKTDNGNSFTIPTFTTDNAGHIISAGNITFYVPHTFKTVRVEAQSNVVTQVTPSSTSTDLVAENIVDTLTIATGNKWVQTTTDENNDRITFSHILSGVTKNTYGTNSSSAIEPKFGDTFEVPGYDVDEAGHITSSTTHTVKIPQANYTDKEEGNVLVGFKLADNTISAFEGTHAYVGTLKLNNYSVTNNENAITAEDTINEAFAKTEARLALEIKNRGDADTQVYNNATKYTDERITSLINAAPEALDTLGELASALKNENEEISTTIVSMITANTNLINANANAISALDASLKVTQTDLNTERDTRIAEDQKLATAIETEAKTREEKDKNHEEALNKEIDARERADQARHEEFTNALAVEIEERNSAINEAIATEVSARDEAISVESNNRDAAIAAAVQQIFDDLLVNYNITLNPPAVVVSQEGLVLTASWDENSTDEYSINWFKKQLDADPILVADTAQVQVNEVGEYYCVLTRVHNNHTASTNSEIFIVTEDMLPPPPEVEEPETPPEVEEPVTPPEE